MMRNVARVDVFQAPAPLANEMMMPLMMALVAKRPSSDRDRQAETSLGEGVQAVINRGTGTARIKAVNGAKDRVGGGMAARLADQKLQHGVPLWRATQAGPLKIGADLSWVVNR